MDIYICLYKIFCGHNILAQCTISVKGYGGKHLLVVFMVWLTDSFCIALFSASKQIHCAHVVCATPNERLTLRNAGSVESTEVVYFQQC